MNEVKAKELLRKYADGTCNEEEKLLFEQWYQNLNRDNHLQLTEGELRQVEQEISAFLKIEKAIKTKHIWPYSIAAAVLLCLGAGFWLNNLKKLPADVKKDNVIAGNLIKPGKNTAVLTLADGKNIMLSDIKSGVIIDAAKLTYNDGTVVATDNNAHNQVTDRPYSGLLKARTPRGGTYQIVLSDGTKVWLNAASELKFPASFSNAKDRKVELSGEAYFEVAKNRAKAFKVSSKGQEIEVIGTHFNINSYSDEGLTKTTLLEGAVKLTVLKGKATASYVLKPGQQATAGTSVLIRNLDAMEVVDWKNGMFIFNKESLESIMREVSRWYDVDIIFEEEHLKSKLLGGRVSRFSTVTEVLEVLELTELAHFKIKGRSIMVMK